MYDITVTGYSGDFGSSLIYRDQRIGKELGSLYPKSFLKALDEPMDAMKVIQGDRELSELFDDHLGGLEVLGVLLFDADHQP